MSDNPDLTSRLLNRNAFARNGAAWVMIPQPDGDCLAAAYEIERLRGALEKIAKRYPCETADAMSRLAGEAIGIQ